MSVAWPPVVLRKHELKVFVSGKQDIQVERGHLRVLPGVVEHLRRIFPAKRSGQHASSRRRNLVKAGGAGMTRGGHVVTALDDTDRQEQEGVNRGIFLRR